MKRTRRVNMKMSEEVYGVVESHLKIYNHVSGGKMSMSDIVEAAVMMLFAMKGELNSKYGRVLQMIVEDKEVIAGLKGKSLQEAARDLALRQVMWEVDKKQ